MVFELESFIFPCISTPTLASERADLYIKKGLYLSVRVHRFFYHKRLQRWKEFPNKNNKRRRKKRYFAIKDARWRILETDLNIHWPMAYSCQHQDWISITIRRSTTKTPFHSFLQNLIRNINKSSFISIFSQIFTRIVPRSG